MTLKYVVGIFLLVSIIAVAPASANNGEAITKNVSVNYFLISGSSIQDIRQDLRRKGPKSFWAETSWHINWSDKCEIALNAEMTLPRLLSTTGMSAADKNKVNMMLLALRLHEERHLEYGVLAAEEIMRHQCQNADEILQYWLKKNDEFDKITLHGRNDGVTLD